MDIRRRYRAVAVLAVVVAAVLVASTAGGAASGASSLGAKARVDTWRGWHTFAGVTVMSPESALTVGQTEEDQCCNAMSQRWDGSRWTYTPPRDGGFSYLADVDSVSETDAWAVGFDFKTNSALTEHWDGHRWRVVLGGGSSVSLGDVDMVAPNDVWAVGIYHWGKIGTDPAVVHWDGTRWNRLAPPFTDGTLITVDAVSDDDVWVAGASNGVWHWDGRAWSKFDADIGDLRTISGVSSNDIWVVGGFGLPLFAHWNGKAWTSVESPPVGPYGGRIEDLVAWSKNDVWAVGYNYTPQYQPHRALIEHWDGRKWTVVRCPHSRWTYDVLTAVDAHSADDVWAVGLFGSDPDYPYHGHRFMLHWDGSTWTRYHH